MVSKIILTFLTSLISTSIIAKDLEIEPWGEDAELVSLKTYNDPKAVDNFTAGFDSIIVFHQKIISQADGPRSHFYPSSSQYMLETVKKYGLFIGYSLGCDRLLRENSDRWVYQVYTTRDGHNLKWDPIPKECGSLLAGLCKNSD